METIQIDRTASTSVTRKNDGLSNILMVGASLVGGGSVTYEAFELVRQEPERAFQLLDHWGPGFLLSMLIAWSVSKIITRALDVAERVGDRMATAQEGVTVQIKSIAEASHAQALALQATADKDGRDKQEMQILIGVVNSKVEQTLDEQKRQNRALERIEDALKINRPTESEQT